jgi:hypothetical protein
MGNGLSCIFSDINSNIESLRIETLLDFFFYLIEQKETGGLLLKGKFEIARNMPLGND